MSLIFTGLVVVLLCLLISGLGWLVSYRSGRYHEKMTAFECGFDAVGSSRVPFSMRFFLLTIIFLVFDVEVVLLFPIFIEGLLPLSVDPLYSLYVFLFILFLGLVHEWNEGSLSWV